MNDETPEQYYGDLFINNPHWNKPYPSSDEAARGAQLLKYTAAIVEQRDPASDGHLNIIDVGCGRGWMVNLLASFGTVIGLDPVSSVVDHARSLFPNLRFVVATLEQYRSSPEFQVADIVVCSEVVEHVPRTDKPAFFSDLAGLLDDNGFLILTTPRGELSPFWIKGRLKTQPIEDWLTEAELSAMLRQNGFEIIARDRCYPTRFHSSRSGILHSRAIRKLFSLMGYMVDHEWRSMIYQVVLARKFGEDPINK